MGSISQGAQSVNECDISIVGGGASGFFTAANLDTEEGLSCSLFEATRQPLQKVKMSGGGRCNVTHNQFDVSQLVENYPRGRRELRGPFSRFQPKDMIEWLRSRGVDTSIERDGRVFPASNQSQTIVDLLKRSALKKGVEPVLGHKLVKVTVDDGGCFLLSFANGDHWRTRCLVLATGGSSVGFKVARELGHQVVAPVPSLFTFNLTDLRFNDLSGVSFPSIAVELRSGGKKWNLQGPLLLTHWGVSGPVILKLSAFAARELNESDYKGTLKIDFVPTVRMDELEVLLAERLLEQSGKQVENVSMEWVPKKYWKSLCAHLDLLGMKGARINKKKLQALVRELKSGEFCFDGKSTHKEEFVTAGGIDLREVNMKTMESKLHRRLYFTGEILNIDGVTGGFNFQNAWTGGFLCAAAINDIVSEGTL